MTSSPQVQFLVHLQRMSIHPAGDELTCSRMTDAALRTSRGRSPSTSTSSPHTTTACHVCCDCALLLARDQFFADCTCQTIIVERIAMHCCRTFRVKTDNSNFCEQCCCRKQPLQFQPTPNTSSKISEHYLVNNDSNYYAYAINWLSSTACDPKCIRRNTPWKACSYQYLLNSVSIGM